MTAPDPMGRDPVALAAAELMVALSGCDVLAALAASTDAEREVRRTALVSYFARYRQITRATVALERVASASAAAGYERDDRAMDIKENAA